MIMQKWFCISFMISMLFTGAINTMEKDIMDSCYVSESLAQLKGDGIRGLFMAVISDDYTMIDFLLDKGVDPNYCDEFGITPLFVAAQLGHVIAAQVLLKYGACIDSSTTSKSTPLFVAAQWGHLEMVKLLIKEGADVCHRNIKRHTPLEIARINKYPDIVQVLEDETQLRAVEIEKERKRAKRKTW